MTCDECGGEMLCVPAQTATLTFRCARCGREVTGVGDPYVDTPRPVWVTVFVEWQGKRASAPQVARLRRLFPDLADRSIAHVIASAHAFPTMSLGNFPQWEADKLVAEARGLNLDLRYTPVTDDSDGAAS